MDCPEFMEGDVIVHIDMYDMWRVESVFSSSHDYYVSRLGCGIGSMRLLWEEADGNYVKVGNVYCGDWKWWDERNSGHGM